MFIMPVSALFLKSNAYLTILITLVAVAGDYLTNSLTSDQYALLKALCDNITHATIGGLSWFMYYMNREKSAPKSKGLVDVVSCTILSSVIDLDHFIAAKAMLLKEAISLKHRPPLHCSTFPVVLVIVLLVIAFGLESPTIKRTALIILTAFSTHHIRDATRRGLWFYPYGSTAPLPYFLYIMLTCLVPYFIIFIDRTLRIGERSRYYEHVI